MDLDKNNPYHQDFFKSVRYMQSEMGVTGDESPNLEYVTNLVQQIGDNFEKKRDGLSQADSMFLVSSVRLGESINGGQVALNTYTVNRGSDEDHVRTFTHFLNAFPQFIRIMGEAVMRASLDMQNRYPEEEGGE